MVWLGVDGGGSGVRAVLADASGRVIGRGLGGPANVMSDREGAIANIVAAARSALGSAEGEVRAVLGLAGANVPGLAAEVEARMPFRARVVSDAVTALAGAFGGGDGVAAIVGTGTVYAARTGDAVAMRGGWGPILGDEGGGAWIGRTLLARALHAETGLVAMTPLLAEVLRAGGGAFGLVALAREATAGAFAAFAPRVIAAVEDPAAAAILGRADDWIAGTIDLLSGPLGPPIALVGGLGPTFAGRLAGRYGARMRVPSGTSLDGALILAREAWPAPDGAP